MSWINYSGNSYYFIILPLHNQYCSPIVLWRDQMGSSQKFQKALAAVGIYYFWHRHMWMGKFKNPNPRSHYIKLPESSGMCKLKDSLDWVRGWPDSWSFLGMFVTLLLEMMTFGTVGWLYHTSWMPWQNNKAEWEQFCSLLEEKNHLCLFTTEIQGLWLWDSGICTSSPQGL